METIELTNFALTLQAYKNCIASNNVEWAEKHKEFLDKECEKLPHGSGLDKGVKFDFEKSDSTKLIFTTSFHHMNDGYYNGWTDHIIKITPTFGHFNLAIGGTDKDQIKEYLFDLFYSVFTVKNENAR